VKVKNYVVYGIVTKIIIRRSGSNVSYSLDDEIDVIYDTLSKLFPISNYVFSKMEDYYLFSIDYCFLIRQIAKYKKCDAVSFLDTNSLMGVDKQSDEDYAGYLLQYTYDKWDFIEIRLCFIPLLYVDYCYKCNLFLLNCNSLDGMMVFIED